jgi:hypothetical protein
MFRREIIQVAGLMLWWAHVSPPIAQAQERIVIDSDFPGGYQVELADVNGDGKLDIVALGGGTCAWYENPAWTKRVITSPTRTPGIISSATADLDGDGKAEVAIAHEFAMNQPARGELVWATQAATVDQPWFLQSLGHFGSIHRLRWGDVDGDGSKDLVVAPIFGPKSTPPEFAQDVASVVVLSPRGKLTTEWRREVAGTQAVLHAIDVLDLDGDGRSDILAAGNDGVVWLKRGAEGVWTRQVLVPGAPGEAPKQGASEVHVGRIADGRAFLATIEPWHGSEVVVWFEKARGSLSFGSRTVLDDTLVDGHALWVADVDGDGTDEVFAGHRGQDRRVSRYDLDGATWTRTVLDSHVAAQDLRGGDLDGDGTPDVVAIGGQTKNVVLYRFPAPTKRQRVSPP